jgi:bifunctional N-acetylglucosamine-1-phosphate-uridyltransferase/glucosamine-1-phosphate-acetyltransferase GlmU-like protein
LEKKGKVSSVQMEHFYQWGTPEDFADFNYWTNSIKKIDERSLGESTEPVQATVILAAGKGERIASHALVPKPAIPVFGKELWTMALRSCVRNSEEVIVLRKDTFPFLTLPSEMQSVLLDAFTQGQADSARLGLEALIDSVGCPVNILASDNVLPINFSKEVHGLMNTLDLQIVIWAAKNYPPAELSPQHFSWVRIESSRIVQVLYKSQPPIDEAGWSVITGNFSFCNKELARDLISKLLAYEESQINGEFYLDSIISIALERGMNIGAIEIPNYFSLGTIDELMTFNYWSGVLMKNFVQVRKCSSE